MPSWLQHLRTKSPKTRHRIALGTSVGVTCLIFVMWVTVLNYGTGEPVESLQAGADNNSQTASPLAAFGDNAVSAFKQLKNGITSAENNSTSTADESPSDSNDFWGKGGEDQTVESGKVNSGPGSETEPFTSRNYNPNQEGEWFSY